MTTIDAILAPLRDELVWLRTVAPLERQDEPLDDLPWGCWPRNA